MNGSQQAPSRIDPKGLYRVKSIVRTKNGGAPLIDVCEATWWAGVKAGRFPQPVRVPGTRMTAWIGADLIAFVDSLRIEEGV